MDYATTYGELASKMRSMDIGITEDNRALIADGLSKLLADTYTLYLKTHNFHWNVTGPMFNLWTALEIWSVPVLEK